MHTYKHVEVTLILEHAFKRGPSLHHSSITRVVEIHVCIHTQNTYTLNYKSLLLVSSLPPIFSGQGKASRKEHVYTHKPSFCLAIEERSCRLPSAQDPGYCRIFCHRLTSSPVESIQSTTSPLLIPEEKHQRRLNRDPTPQPTQKDG